MAENEWVVLDEPAKGVRRITLNRPDKRNAISNALRAQLLEALHDAAVAEAIFTISAGLHAVDIVDVDLETPPLSPQLTAMQKGQRYVSTNCAPMRQRPPRECGGRRSRPPTMRSRRRKYTVGLES